ncbi:MAG: 2-oxoacid:acceptor oxidoreductase family protein, partial [Elusimicrobia bacterium]|nr:2-oxoacid:acceptor oxidoreductase family protein [Elusimicrobiota bacterium]
EVCEYCLECTRATGCPGLTVEETDFGPKIVTDLSTCVSDGACTKGKVCPSFEKIVIRRKNPPARKGFFRDPATLPLPSSPAQFEETYYITTFAVGGMGSGVVSAILVRAGMKEGYRVLFADKKGLAIRNGGVYGYVIYSKNQEQVLAPVVPYGKANLILGVDLLETTRGLDPRMHMMVTNPARTAAVVNRHKTETVPSLMGRESFNPETLESKIKERTRKENYFSVDFSELSQKLLGSKLYANLLIVGAAFQSGGLPLSLESLVSAIRETVSKEDLEDNIKALHLGREIVMEPQKFISLIEKKKLSYHQIIDLKSKILSRRIFLGKKISLQYRQMVEHAVRWMHMDEGTNQKIALRVYELIQYQNADLAEQYLSLLWEVYRKDRSDHTATKAAMENLFKVLLIKDEVYVAHLLTSSEKFERDRERYGIQPENGDSVSYVHFNRPQVSFFGLDLELDMDTRNWMLTIVKHGKFLRKLLPEWHRREKEFRDWYVDLVRKFNYFESEVAYRTYVEILKSPELVSGYREIRYPKMEEARKKVEQLLARIEPLTGQVKEQAGSDFETHLP